MNMDIRTLAILLGIANVLQAIAIFIQYLIDKTCRGVGWWVLGFASLTLGFVLVLLRDVVSMKRNNGDQLAGMTSAKINALQGIPHMISVANDMSERRRMEEKLRDSEKRYLELSIMDDLTQLYNSRYFYFHLKTEITRANRYEQPLTLLLLDLDNFKAFNDSYGRVEGDKVLLRIGQVIKRCLRQTDSAYRYGGEEFTVILPMTRTEGGAVAAERIRTELRKENFSPASDQQVHVTMSIGLAQYRAQEDMEAFVHRIDQLMDQGKKTGKDKVCSES